MPYKTEEARRAYRLRNRAKINAYKKSPARYAKALARQNDLYRHDHEFRERRKEKSRCYRAAHTEQVRERDRQRRTYNSPQWRVSRDTALRRQYGISLAEYEAREAAQNGKCALCGWFPDPNNKKKHHRLNVDHDHANGRVRGLLCGSCNRSVGQLGDTVSGLERAIRYLTGAS